MHKIKYRVINITLMGVLFGICNAFLFVNPYQGQTTLTELILQLSGSRGELALGHSITELLNLSMRLFPTFIFELYIGTELYHYFCTASVYIFSRIEKRLKWYRHEIFAVTLLSFAYEIVYLISSFSTTALRYQVDVNLAGVLVCIYHFLLYSFWTCSVTILINLLAIYFGSNSSFLILTGIQFALTTLLSFMRFYVDNPNLTIAIMNLNPISHLVLGWHRSYCEVVDNAIGSPYNGLHLEGTLLFILFFYLICMLVGGYLIKNHDLLISNTGMEEL